MATTLAATPRAHRLVEQLDDRRVLSFLIMLPAAAQLKNFLAYPKGLGNWHAFTDTKNCRAGVFICFDVNFPEVWQKLADAGAELVVWPSAYSAGTSLQAHAINHHLYIVTSTWLADCIVYDITGQEIHYQKGDGFNVSRITLDLGHVPGPQTCELVAVGTDGTRQSVATWAVPPTGYGATTGLRTEGGSGLPPAAIARFEVRSGTSVLVTVPLPAAHWKQ